MGGNPAPDWATGPSATSRASSSSAGTPPEESPSSSGRRPGTPPAMPGTVSRAPAPDPSTRCATVTDGEALTTHTGDHNEKDSLVGSIRTPALHGGHGGREGRGSRRHELEGRRRAGQHGPEQG